MFSLHVQQQIPQKLKLDTTAAAQWSKAVECVCVCVCMCAHVYVYACVCMWDRERKDNAEAWIKTHKIQGQSGITLLIGEHHQLNHNLGLKSDALDSWRLIRKFPDGSVNTWWTCSLVQWIQGVLLLHLKHFLTFDSPKAVLLGWVRLRMGFA